MNFYAPPPVITAKVLSSVPRSLYPEELKEWNTTYGLKPMTNFLEGPTTDTNGNLFVVDVIYGKVLRCDLKSNTWSQVIEYDGEPNGLALSDDGKLVVADYKMGLLELEPSTGQIRPLLERVNREHFRGLNDVIVSRKGEIYFTDQGQSGMSDPYGRVFRLNPDGRLDCLVDNGVSPNGLVLTEDEKFLFVGMTRDNSVWRIPIHSHGGTTKVGKFFQSFGNAGPDGLTVDKKGNLFICHPSLLSIFVVDRHGLPVARIVPPEGHGNSVANCIFGSMPEDSNRLYFVDSTVGRICYVDWDCEGVTPLRAST